MNANMLIAGLAVAMTAGTAWADFTADAHLLRTYTVGEPSGPHTRATPGAVYSDIDTFSGSAFANGGAALQAVEQRIGAVGQLAEKSVRRG